MKIENWGTVHYEEATRRQMELLDVVADGAEERLILCTHPPVVTLGRGTTEGDVFAWRGETIATSRGGRATYHGPSQIVIYPIVDLRKPRPGIPAKDVHAYLRALEQATVAALNELGLANAEARTTKVGDISLTGVWVGEKKIASIGIAVSKWITYHGVAANIWRDESAFSGIHPCGFSRDVMTCLEKELNSKIDPISIAEIFGEQFRSRLKSGT